MDKQLIERIALEVCDGIPLEMKTHLPGYSVRFAERFLARIDAERGKDAIGYVEKHMLGMIKEYGFAHAEISTINRSSSRVPLFLSPAIPEGMALVPANEIQSVKVQGDSAVVIQVTSCRAACEIKAMLAAAQGGRK